MVAIIILNWNGWEDTIECLKSIKKVEDTEYCTVVVDNGSTNESIVRISEFINQGDNKGIIIEEGQRLRNPIKSNDSILYKLGQNYGFAKGNNLGIQLLKGQKIDYYWILNNDTIIEKESLGILHTFMELYPKYSACTPQIRYYNPQNRIWNCGGKLFFGLRKYYYEGQDNVVFKNPYFDISFVTGCALFVRPELVNNQGALFTELFFFGEEDFELSLRMKDKKQKMACCTRSIIYHKVSASIKKKPMLSGIYIHYLNRYINIRHHFSSLKFCMWKTLNNINIKRQLRKNGFSSDVAKHFVKELNCDCIKYNGVSKELFETIRLEKE